MNIRIVPLYAGLLALFYFFLTIRTVILRGKTKVAIGHEGNRRLERGIRAHANFMEYVPIILILLLLLEMRQAPALLLHVFGIVLVLARLSHAYGISHEPENFRYRISGMVPTMLLLVVTGALNFCYAILSF